MQKDDIQLVKISEYRWHDHVIPIWQPVDNRGKPLSGGVIFMSDMAEALQGHFKVWLASQPLSISRPPLGLPRRSVSYFAQDVVIALEQIEAEL
ncbi:hypothetical protein QF022_002746 [Vogesella perlucida]|nr:hypothetical protein [Vogesella perlucida]